MKAYLKYILLLAVLAIGVGVYMYNKPHQNIKKAKADFKLEATELFSQFEADEASANEKYLDKLIQVSGIVTDTAIDEAGQVSITLDAGNSMFGIICKLDDLTKHKRTTFQPGEKINLKGVCTGMLMDVVLVRCVEIL